MKCFIFRPTFELFTHTLPQLLANLFWFNLLWRVFDDIDGGDRCIEVTEFRKGIKRLGLDLTREETIDAFAKMDRNGGGVVRFDEFCLFVRKEIGHEAAPSPLSEEDAKEIKVCFDLSPGTPSRLKEAKEKLDRVRQNTGKWRQITVLNTEDNLSSSSSVVEASTWCDVPQLSFFPKFTCVEYTYSMQEKGKSLLLSPPSSETASGGQLHFLVSNSWAGHCKYLFLPHPVFDFTCLPLDSHYPP